MKTDNIFDLMYDDPNGIDRKVTGNTSVSIDNVQRLVSRKTGAETKAPKKKHSRRKLAAALIAAALSVVILCTTAAATGLMDTVFGGRVEVKTDSIPITATPVDVESDDLNIVLDGMTGDAEEVYATFTITKKDGSNFINGIEDVSELEINHNSNENTGYTIYTASSEDGQLKRNSKSSVIFSLVDSKTINAFVSVTKHLTPLETISVSNPQIKVTRYVKTVHQFERENTDDTNFFFNYKENKEYIDHIIADYQPHLKENEKVGFDFDRCAVTVYEDYYIPLQFRITYTADFGGERIDMISEPIFVRGDKWSFVITGITVSNTELWISAEGAEKVIDYLPLFAEDYITVNLKNGKNVKAELSECGNPYDPELGYDDGTAFESKYTFGHRENSIYGITYTPVDPTEIESITIDGVMVQLSTK